MRQFWLVAVALVLAGTWLHAQQPGVADPNAAKLDEVLRQWEKSMSSMDTLLLYCRRITKDKTFGTVDEYQGSAKFLRSKLPNQSSRGSLELFKMVNQNGKMVAQGAVFEKFICTGTFLYEYVPADKVIRVHEMAAPKQGQVSDDNFLGFLFGMKARDVKERYHMIYVPAKDNEFYHYVRILPKAPEDKTEFSEARLVLSAKTCLPRQLWFQHPNGTEITWDLPKVEPNNDKIRATDFGQPALPAGWQFVRVPQNPQVRLIRPGKQ